jgi:hypothetical protein
LAGAELTGPLLTGALLKGVSRSFYLSLAVLPREIRPTVGLAYLFARAADTIADTRLLPRAQRLTHLTAFRDELDAPGPGRLEALLRPVIAATRPGQALEAERALLERLPDCFAAYRALPRADADRVRGCWAPSSRECARTSPASPARTRAGSPPWRPARSWTATPISWPAAWASSGPRSTWPTGPGSATGIP